MADIIKLIYRNIEALSIHLSVTVYLSKISSIEILARNGNYRNGKSLTPLRIIQCRSMRSVQGTKSTRSPYIEAIIQLNVYGSKTFRFTARGKRWPLGHFHNTYKTQSTSKTQQPSCHRRRTDNIGTKLHCRSIH